MNILQPDDIDFSAYMRSTEFSVKVKPASVFDDALHNEFADRDPNHLPIEMFSTKLRRVLEFRHSEVTCWAGYSGHRKSMFTGQAALDLCVLGQRTMVASFEMAPERTLARMARQAWGLARPPAWQLTKFSQWTNDRLWMFAHVGTVTVENCMAVCRYFAEELGGQHVFIDSMMMVCASEESNDEQKRFMTSLVRLAQETRMHVHLVTHCRKPNGTDDKPPTKYDLRGSAAISDQAHNVVTVWMNKPKQARLERDPGDAAAREEPDALVSVEKQRNGSYEGRKKLWFDEASMRFTDERTTRVEAYRALVDD